MNEVNENVTVNGAVMDDVFGQIAVTYQVHYIDYDMDVSAVTDFDNVKDKIVCKRINEEANRQFLEDKPYTKVENLAVVYQILMDKNLRNDFRIMCMNMMQKNMSCFAVNVSNRKRKSVMS